MLRNKKTVSVTVALLVCAAVHSQTACRLNPDTILLGDQTTLSGSFGQIAGEDIVVVHIADDTASGQHSAVLTCFEPGVHFVHVGEGDSLPLVVNDIAVDTARAELRDIAPLQRIPYTFWEIFRWVLLALAVAFAGWGIWRLWAAWERRRDESGTGVALSDPRPPDIRALEALESLRTRQLWQAGRTKEYHTELTDIVRRFIEEATGIHATELTSAETLEALASGPWGVDLDPLRTIFTTADLVKFAKSEPLSHEHERSMREGISFVQALWSAARPDEETPINEKGEEASHA